MEEIGYVTAVNGSYATVSIGRKSGCCDSCEKSSCDIPEDGITTDALNTAGAKTGQRVKIEMRSHTYIKGVLILYIIPVLSLFIGLVLGNTYLPEIFRNSDEELLSALGGLFALSASLIIVKLLSSQMEKNTLHRPEISEVLGS